MKQDFEEEKYKRIEDIFILLTVLSVNTFIFSCFTLNIWTSPRLQT